MIIVGPNNGDYGIFFSFLQSAKPDSWKEKLSSNAFARKVISKYTARAWMYMPRDIDYCLAFYANSLFLFLPLL